MCDCMNLLVIMDTIYVGPIYTKNIYVILCDCTTLQGRKFGT